MGDKRSSLSLREPGGGQGVRGRKSSDEVRWDGGRELVRHGRSSKYPCGRMGAEGGGRTGRGWGSEFKPDTRTGLLTAEVLVRLAADVDLERVSIQRFTASNVQCKRQSQIKSVWSVETHTLAGPMPPNWRVGEKKRVYID